MDNEATLSHEESESSVICPSCGATLRKIRLEPGAILRCLNCGAHVIVGASGGVGSLADARSAAPDGGLSAPYTREPGRPEYWLLRIPAIVLCALSCLGTGLLLKTQFQHFSNNALRWSEWCYLPLVPWGGFFLFFLTRSLARIDAYGTAMAWRTGLLKAPLPPPIGSNLPYILPLAIAGGVFPIIAIETAAGPKNEAAIFGASVGALLFYAGFAMEDLRKFAWRQKLLAKACCQPNATGPSAVIDPASLFSSAFWLPLAAVCCAIALFLLALYLSWRRGRWDSENEMALCAGVWLLGLAFTLWSLGRTWDSAMACWELAAANTDPLALNERRQGLSQTLPVGIRRVCAVPLVWSPCAAIWMVLMLNQHPPNSVFDTIALECMLLAACSFAVWLAKFLMNTSRWQRAQQHVWTLHHVGEPKDKIHGRPLYATMVWSVVCLMAVDSLLFVLSMSSISWSRWASHAANVIGFPLLLIAMHYPVIWLAVLLREFLKLEWFFKIKSDAPAVKDST